MTLMSTPDPALFGNGLTLTATITMDLPPVVPDGIRWSFLVDVGSGGSGDNQTGEDMGVEIVEGEGITFSEDRRTLTISSLSYGNERLYTVRVMNVFGDFEGVATDSAFVDVQGRERGKGGGEERKKERVGREGREEGERVRKREKGERENVERDTQEAIMEG